MTCSRASIWSEGQPELGHGGIRPARGQIVNDADDIDASCARRAPAAALSRNGYYGDHEDIPPTVDLASDTESAGDTESAENTEYTDTQRTRPPGVAAAAPTTSCAALGAHTPRRGVCVFCVVCAPCVVCVRRKLIHRRGYRSDVAGERQ